MYCPVEVRDLATEQVDPFGRGHGAGEHRLLDLVDVLFKTRDHRPVPVDHLVEDRPQHGRRPEPEKLGVPLEAGPCRGKLTGHALPDGDHEVRPDEHADLAEVDLLTGVVVPGGAQDDEVDAVAVTLDLGSHVERPGVLDRQFVQVECVTHLVEFLDTRLEQPEPNEAAVGGGMAPGGCVLQAHCAAV